MMEDELLAAVLKVAGDKDMRRCLRDATTAEADRKLHAKDNLKEITQIVSTQAAAQLGWQFIKN